MRAFRSVPLPAQLLHQLAVLERLEDFAGFWFTLIAFVDGYSRSALEGMTPPHDEQVVMSLTEVRCKALPSCRASTS
eukprot:SAG22_NODE_1233_length_5065_cov_12.050141_7_plen_77_part_00